MNQDKNPFNQNNFNLKDNNGIPNNQPLNKQNFTNSQTNINNQQPITNTNSLNNQNQINSNVYHQSTETIEMNDNSTINSNFFNAENQNHSINIKNNNSQKSNVAITIAFILMIVSFLTLIVSKSYVCLIFSIISSIISLVNIKKKNFLNIISLLGNVLIIIFSIVSFVYSINKVNDIINDAKIESRKRDEKLLEANAEYIVITMILKNKLSKEEDKILTKKDFEDYNETYNTNCEFYVIANFNDNKYEAYIKCNDYITEGFDEKYLSNIGLDNSLNNSSNQQNSNDNQVSTSNTENLKSAKNIYQMLEYIHVSLLMQSKEITLNNIVNSFNLDGYYITDIGHVNTREGRNLCKVSVDNKKIYLDCDSINYHNYININ